MSLESMGLTPEEFNRAKGIAADIVVAISQHPVPLISILTSLTLVAAGLIHKMPEEHREGITKVTKALLDTALKTYAYTDTEPAKGDEVIH